MLTNTRVSAALERFVWRTVRLSIQGDPSFLPENSNSEHIYGIKVSVFTIETRVQAAMPGVCRFRLEKRRPDERAFEHISVQ
jgi:hypothetical protein